MYFYPKISHTWQLRIVQSSEKRQTKKCHSECLPCLAQCEAGNEESHGLVIHIMIQ